jgi:hypothetical protein
VGGAIYLAVKICSGQIACSGQINPGRGSRYLFHRASNGGILNQGSFDGFRHGQSRLLLRGGNELGAAKQQRHTNSSIHGDVRLFIARLLAPCASSRRMCLPAKSLTSERPFRRWHCSYRGRLLRVGVCTCPETSGVLKLMDHRRFLLAEFV